MSGKLKEIRRRIKAVADTQQTTKAMKMVSAAKLRKAQDAILQMRPYDAKLQEILNHILESVEGEMPIIYAQEREVKRALLVLVTSDRGLCGSFNANLIRMTQQILLERSDEKTLLCIGKKGYDFFKKRYKKIVSDYVHLFSTLNFASSAAVAEQLMKDFTNETYDRVEVIYMHFKNAATQYVMKEQLLPIMKNEQQSGNRVRPTIRPDFIFEPSREVILTEIIPMCIKTRFFRMLLDSNASEHGARMTAMSKATDNANELLRELRLSFNKARQEAITKELSEIVGGANALAEG